MKRTEQLEKNTWNLSDLYPSLADWENEFKNVQSKMDVAKEFRGRLMDPVWLKDCFVFTDDLHLLIERLYVFANMWHHEDTDKPEPQALVARISKLSSEVGEALSFVSPELLSLSDLELESLIQHPELIEYKDDLQSLIKEKKHLLSEAEEMLMAQVSQMAHSSCQTYDLLVDADLRFPSIEDESGNQIPLTQGNYRELMESPYREVRKRAFEAMLGTYGQFRNTFASTLSGNTQANLFYAKVRKYDSPLQQALSGNDIPVSVYTNLIQAIHERLPLLHRYYHLRKQILGLEELHLHDLSVSLTSEKEQEISFEEAKKTVFDSLNPLGSEYLDVLDRSFRDRWIDVYENEGKHGGAYSWGAYGTHPYVLLNHKDNLDSMFTLTHEMGHALHSHFSDEALPYREAQYAIFNAEVASTCNEALLMQHLLKETKEDQARLHLLTHYADQFRGTVYRQVMFAEFEKNLHDMAQDGEALTAQTISEMYLELVTKYHGPDVVMNELIQYEWARIPHFYNSFYVYQYATGFSAATSLSHQILSEGQPAVDRYLQFLRSGGNEDPITLLQRAGVDMTSTKPVHQALDVFEDVLNQIEALSKKLGLI